MHRTIHYVQKALCARFAELSCALEFGGVLRESGAESRANVNDGGGGFHPGQGGPHESIGSEQQMIAPVSATCMAEIMHDGPPSEIEPRQQVDSTNGDRILWPSQRPPLAQTP